MRRGAAWPWALLALGLLAFSTLQYRHLSYPLLWQDEGETVMLGQRVLEFGYPRADDGRNLVYGMGVPLAVGIKQGSGAYIGSLWGQYYFAALGVALAAGVDDLHARTALLRLPFALAGSVGLLLLFRAARPGFGRHAHALPCAAAAFCLLLALSTSLLLHLREARYYALVVLLLGAAVWLHARRFWSASEEPVRPGRRLAAGPVQPLLQGLALLLLFNVFYPAAVSVGFWLAAEAGLLAARAGSDAGQRWRGALPLLAPIAAAVLLCLPIASYFEMVSVSRSLAARWDFGPMGYLGNLGYSLFFLLRYELLGPVVALWLYRLTFRGTQARENAEARRALVMSASLLRLIAIWVGVGAANPIFFERYLVPVSPLLSLVLLLEASVLLRGVRAAGAVPLAQRAALRLAAVAALTLLVVISVKRVELAGHLAQVATPYLGPLDFVIPALQDRFEEPEELTIATNYEAEPYMYYLGSRVVGRFHGGTARADAAESAVRVDVVVPRRQQPRSYEPVRRYLEQGRFTRHVLPVADLPYNEIPELYEGRVLSTTHLFRTQRTTGGSGSLSYYVLAD